MRLVIANRVVAEVGADGVFCMDVQPTSAQRMVQASARIGARYQRHYDRGNMSQSMTILVYRQLPSADAAERFALRHATLIGGLSGEGVEYLDSAGLRYLFPDGVLESMAVTERAGCAITHSYTFRFGAIFRGWQIAISDGGVTKIITLTTPLDGTIIPLIEAN